ncbi:MAG: 5-methyltetrahydropteroyltriglutamate--homocysteine S-methyltransferase [Chloroflexi bacterium]|nr:5-methyltetrahydropteroyltriglutamate--homocysteine S-methyltransferase [Chloroflexota bacterium]
MTFEARLIGYPRIGPNRELKWTLERAWSGRLDAEAFAPRIAELRQAHLDEQHDAIGSAVDDYFLYDEVLETALMLGIAPENEAARIGDSAFDVLTDLARGTPEREAWEMTKWFDTNYHYVVPEIGRPIGTLRPLPWREPLGQPDTTWAILGPYSLVKLSKLDPALHPADLAAAAGEAIWTWVRDHAATDEHFRLQLDEPCLGMVMDDADVALRDAAYANAADLLAGLGQPPIVTVQFGRASAETVASLGGAGFAVQVPVDAVASMRSTPAWEAQPAHVVAVMDGRSVWPDDFDAARAALDGADDGRPTYLVPSTSLMFLPVTVEGEDLPAGFQFAREKARALAGWPSALEGGSAPDVPQPPPVEWPEVGDLVARASREERRSAQADLDLPPYPTTTTGSLPQTSEVRQLRVSLGRGELDRAGYDAAMAKLITDSVAWQERMGLDVLVHGEFERTDMVEYFAEQMDGFHTTSNGWVLSYGSRCVRAPILAAPPSISEPMTVDEWRVAQDATDKPVKGMLTGPVTIVNWSFRPPGVADDRLFWAVARPIREEVGHLVEAGARVIQVDEPAVRERWPLPTEDAPRLREIYARGVRAALNHVFDQPAHVQMHTHMCYGDFGDIVPLWSDAGVDVASVEYSRSKDDSYIRQFYGLFSDGHLQIGPGVFDVHSPHTPGRDVMTERLHHFRAFMDEVDLWVNPDCGLKTRRWEEIEQQLGDMVAAARELRVASA